MTMWINFEPRDKCVDCRFYKPQKSTRRCEIRAMQYEERGYTYRSAEEREADCRGGRGLHRNCFEAKIGE